MNNEIKQKCNICKENLGFVNSELGVFDARYYTNLEKHTCKQWTKIKEI